SKCTLTNRRLIIEEDPHFRSGTLQVYLRDITQVTPRGLVMPAVHVDLIGANLMIQPVERDDKWRIANALTDAMKAPATPPVSVAPSESAAPREGVVAEIRLDGAPVGVTPTRDG